MQYNRLSALHGSTLIRKRSSNTQQWFSPSNIYVSPTCYAMLVYFTRVLDFHRRSHKHTQAWCNQRRNTLRRFICHLNRFVRVRLRFFIINDVGPLDVGRWRLKSCGSLLRVRVCARARVCISAAVWFGWNWRLNTHACLITITNYQKQTCERASEWVIEECNWKVFLLFLLPSHIHMFATSHKRKHTTGVKADHRPTHTRSQCHSHRHIQFSANFCGFGGFERVTIRHDAHWSRFRCIRC